MTRRLRRSARTVLPLLVAVGALVACGDDESRPGAASWEPRWVATQALVPDGAEMDGSDEVCEETLGELRASRTELVPAPTPALDQRVGEWLAEAEGLMLDCPGDGEERDEVFDELEVLAAEIDAALEIAAEG